MPFLRKPGRRMNMSEQNNEMNIISPETLRTEYVTPENCRFSRSENGFLSAVVKGTEHKRVTLTRALPLSMPDCYISISDVEKKEIGIIEKVSEFSEEQQALISEELERNYYCPVVTEVKSIKEKFGNFYFDVLIGEYKKSFTVKDLTKNVRYHGKGFDIIDVDGNRYCIEDFYGITSKSRKKLEPYLY